MRGTLRRTSAATVAALVAVVLVAVALVGCTGPATSSAERGPVASPGPSSTPSGAPLVGRSPAAGPTSGAAVYAAAGAGMLAPAARAAKPLVYVPDTIADRVDVIDPSTYRVVRRFRVGAEPQHVVPSWDLRTLWVNDDHGDDLVPIDPRTGRAGRPVHVADPYNLYFTPDGAHALVMAERLRRIDVLDTRTMRLERSLPVPCRGVNHADVTADGAWMLVSCEFSGRLLVVPTSLSRVARVIDLNVWPTPGTPSAAMIRSMGGPVAGIDPGVSAMPQDVRLTPDGSTFAVADMLRGGVWRVDVATRSVVGFVATGAGAHGVYPSRDATRLYVSNRDAGTVGVLDATASRVLTTWRLPRGSSPDMGGVSADGRRLWLSGRYSSAVYVIDTATGRLVRTIEVGAGPHGLLVWPQPGRFSLGHTGNMR